MGGLASVIVFVCDVFEICVYQFKGFFGVVGWFDVVLRSKYAVFLEAFVGNVCSCVVEKSVSGSSSCVWHNGWSSRLLREFSTNMTCPSYFLKERVMLCLRNGNI